MKTPSEKVAKELLQDVLLGVENSGKAIYVTTFASHLARIRSIIDCGKRMKRKVVILGRSMGRYIRAAENLDLVKFSKETDMSVYRNEIKKKLAEINKNPGKYLIIGTGNQGEPNSILDKIVNGVFPFSLKEGDHVIFSCKTIPHPMNIANRAAIEEKLKRFKVRIFTEIHVSGHAAREDLRDFIEMVKPQNVIPAHGDNNMENSLAELCEEIGYKRGKNVFVLSDGDRIGVE
jgi:ribonuclease J